MFKNQVLAIIIFLLSGNIAHAEESAREKAMRMLDAMGGAAVWSEIRTIHNRAVNHHPDARLPYIQEYWYDTHVPRHYIKLNNFDVDRIRAYSSESGWSITEGKFANFSEERLDSEIRSWSRSLYRKFYLLATDPNSLELTAGREGRIEFIHEGKFIGWMVIDEDGAPTRHGSTPSSDDYTNFGPLAQFGPISWPESGNDDAGWDFEILSVDISNDEMPHSVAPPDDN